MSPFSPHSTLLYAALYGSTGFESRKSLILLAPSPGFEPEGRGFRSAKGRLDIASFAGSRIPPGVPFKLDHRVPQAPRSGLGRGGFDSGAQRRVESLPACHWNQGVRRFFEIAFLGLGRIGPSRVTEVSEREVGFLLAERMGIDSKRESRVGVAKLIGHPADVLARVKHEGRQPTTVLLFDLGLVGLAVRRRS